MFRLTNLMLLLAVSSSLALADEETPARQAQKEAQRQRDLAVKTLQDAAAERQRAVEAQAEALKQREIAEKNRAMAEEQRAIAEQQRKAALMQAEKAKLAAEAEAKARAAEAQARKAAEQALQQLKMEMQKALAAEAQAKMQAEQARQAAEEALKRVQAQTPQAQPDKRPGRNRRHKFAELAKQIESLTQQVAKLQAELNAIRGQLKGAAVKPGAKKTEQSKLSDLGAKIDQEIQKRREQQSLKNQKSIIDEEIQKRREQQSLKSQLELQEAAVKRQLETSQQVLKFLLNGENLRKTQELEALKKASEAKTMQEQKERLIREREAQQREK